MRMTEAPLEYVIPPNFLPTSVLEVTGSDRAQAAGLASSCITCTLEELVVQVQWRSWWWWCSRGGGGGDGGRVEEVVVLVQ